MTLLGLFYDKIPARNGNFTAILNYYLSQTERITLRFYQYDLSYGHTLRHYIHDRSATAFCKGFPEIRTESPRSMTLSERGWGKLAILNQKVAVSQKQCLCVYCNAVELSKAAVSRQ